MNYRQLTRKLRQLGCEFDQSAKGDHEIWINIGTHVRTTIPNWGSKDLKAGTISGILRNPGVSRERFERV